MQFAGVVQSANDHSLFSQHTSDHITLLIVYEGDIIVTGSSENAISDLKSFLHSHIHIKDLGSLLYFLDIKVARSKSGIYLKSKPTQVCIGVVDRFWFDRG